MPAYIVVAPADTGTVRRFIDTERSAILKDLASVRSCVTAALSGHPVYKIYGRDEKQSGDPIKHMRKIRLKFNKYFSSGSRGSLWSIPDIVGFTVVVAYPTDISLVCEQIDRLIDAGELVCGGLVTDDATKKAAEKVITTKHGRPFVTDGYFACHYNVKVRGVRDRVMCEIQIKTILHDAWGAKTHDLTYKPSGRISKDLINSFNLMGDTLAKIDQQSDLVRHSIERAASPRENKERRVRVETIKAATNTFAADPKFTDLCAKIRAVKPGSSSGEVEECRVQLYSIFDTAPKESCYLFALLATLSRDESLFQATLDAVETWYELTEEPIERIYVRQIAGLISYCAGALHSAIDFAEEAARLLETFDLSEASNTDIERLNRMSNSVFSSLSYYHANAIGSHDGDLLSSESKAISFLERARELWPKIGVPQTGIMSEDAVIKDCLSSVEPRQQARTFQTLENEIYVLIQTAKSEAELRILRKKLDILYKEKPQSLEPAADHFHDYHDYCVRARLAELESQENYLPSSSKGKRI